MSFQNLLSRLLESGTAQYDEAKRSGDLQKYATGAAAGGALALLLGSRRGRSLGGKALKYGTIAAIGSLAWKAWQEHQARQAAPASPMTTPSAPAGPARFEALPAPELEAHSRAMLKAMISAAKADGHMDDRERAVVEAELTRLDADAATRTFVETELRRPIDPAEVAAASSGPQMASEMYLASVIVADATSTMERAYLDELARALKLDPALKADLEAKARENR